MFLRAEIRCKNIFRLQINEVFFFGIRLQNTVVLNIIGGDNCFLIRRYIFRLLFFRSARPRRLRNIFRISRRISQKNGFFRVMFPRAEIRCKNVFRLEINEVFFFPGIKFRNIRLHQNRLFQTVGSDNCFRIRIGELLRLTIFICFCIMFTACTLNIRFKNVFFFFFFFHIIAVAYTLNIQFNNIFFFFFQVP